MNTLPLTQDTDRETINRMKALIRAAYDDGAEITRDHLGQHGFTPAQITLHWNSAVAEFHNEQQRNLK